MTRAVKIVISVTLMMAAAVTLSIVLSASNEMSDNTHHLKRGLQETEDPNEDTTESFDLPPPSDDSYEYCDAKARPQDCDSKGIDLVCAYYSGNQCPGKLCSNTVKNPCRACWNEDVMYWTPGACEVESYNRQVVDFDNRPEECPAEKKPVCANYFDSCISNYCATTFDNECKARQNEKVLTFAPGPCTYSCKGVRENKQSNWLPTSPVCGLSSGDCDGGQCRKSYRNAHNACLDSAVETYYLGLCRGDRGVKCPEKLPQECSKEQFELEYIEGRKPNCTKNCWKTYNSWCEACSKKATVYRVASPPPPKEPEEVVVPEQSSPIRYFTPEVGKPIPTVRH
jgi:hypothetical protein